MVVANSLARSKAGEVWVRQVDGCGQTRKCQLRSGVQNERLTTNATYSTLSEAGFWCCRIAVRAVAGGGCSLTGFNAVCRCCFSVHLPKVSIAAAAPKREGEKTPTPTFRSFHLFTLLIAGC